MLIQMNLSEEEIRVLNYKRFREKSPQIQKRLHAVYLKAALQMSNSHIAMILDAHRNSVNKWIDTCLEKGLSELTTTHYTPRRSEPDAYAETIKASLSWIFVQSTKELSHKIFELTSLSRGLTQVRKFVKKSGFKYLQTGHIPAKADNGKQMEWKETVLDNAVNEAEKGDSVLLFLDAAHFVLEPFICKIWSLTGKFVKASAGRNRLNVLGAVNAVTKQVTTLINDTFIDAGVVIAFLEQLRREYGDKTIQIILDNARYQHCKAVEEMAKNLNIRLLFLPPYSSNLNIIERLWKFTKKKILYGKYYDTPQKFHNTVRDFFDSINTDSQPDLIKLLTLRFQFFDNSIAQNYAA
jgi:transposase